MKTEVDIRNKNHHRFIKAAFEVFLQEGFANASMQSIVKKSGGSLSTIYKIFGSKEGLYLAAVDYKSAKVFCEFEDLIKEAEDRSVEYVLSSFGDKILDVLLSDESALVVRIAMSEGYKNGGELGKLFLEKGLSRAFESLSKYIKKQQEKGVFRECDSEIAASRFFQIVKEPFHFRMIVTGEIPDIDDGRCKEIVDDAVKFFMRAMASDKEL